MGYVPVSCNTTLSGADYLICEMSPHYNHGKGRMNTEAKAIELLEAVDLLRKAGWTIEPPAKRRATKRVGRPPAKRSKKAVKTGRRVGRPPKNGRRKRGRPRKQEA